MGEIEADFGALSIETTLLGRLFPRHGRAYGQNQHHQPSCREECAKGPGGSRSQTYLRKQRFRFFNRRILRFGGFADFEF